MIYISIRFFFCREITLEYDKNEYGNLRAYIPKVFAMGYRPETIIKKQFYYLMIIRFLRVLPETAAPPYPWKGESFPGNLAGTIKYV